ncbi:GIN domain-containing protein [Flavobacterium sp.]|uniref:GIN domain-containing protein n=1 Tax=Flavobacterium sp. TaxID=239 RepID=UPI002FDD1391
MKKFALYFLSLILMGSCGISEDCFKGNGNQITQTFAFEGFTKIKVYDGVGLVVKEGPNYEVKIATSDNIIDNIEVKLQDNMLVIKDNSTCNIARDYGQTTVIITIPDGTVFPLIQELELHCKSEQKIQSEGILHSPIVRLFSLGDDGDGAGTGDFYINVDNGQFVVESNNVSNFYINGHSNEMLLNFYFGNGRFYGKDLHVENIRVYHRGSNDMMVYPIQKIEGTISATGNIILKNVPPVVDVEELFRGRVIY